MAKRGVAIHKYSEIDLHWRRPLELELKGHLDCVD